MGGLVQACHRCVARGDLIDVKPFRFQGFREELQIFVSSAIKIFVSCLILRMAVGIFLPPVCRPSFGAPFTAFSS